MTEPDRLVASSDNAPARLLLRAGRVGAPTGARERALIAASSVMAGATLAAPAAASPAVVAKLGPLTTLGGLKGAAVLGVASAVLVASATIPVRPTRRATDAVASVRATSPVASAPLPARPFASVAREPPAPVIPSARLEERAPPVQSLAHSAEPPAHAPPPNIADELATLDQARRAIDSGEPARALAILDEYPLHHPRAAMEQEAAVLRIEALVKAGDRPAAERAATTFLGAHPTSPYAARVQSLIGVSNP